jgi:hypothetical protein
VIDGRAMFRAATHTSQSHGSSYERWRRKDALGRTPLLEGEDFSIQNFKFLKRNLEFLRELSSQSFARERK